MSVHVDVVQVGITNTYLIRDRGAIVIDPGQPGKGPAVIKKLSRRLDRLRDIQLIIGTHGHYDHVGCGDILRDATGAGIAIHQGDAHWMERGILAIPPGLTRWGRAVSCVGKVILPRVLDVHPIEPDTVVGDDGCSLSDYGIAGRIVHTPGHTPGSICVLLDSGDLFVGDSAMNGLPFTFRPSLPIFADDLALLRASWRRLLETGAHTIHPGHGRPFAAEALRTLLDRDSE